MDDPIRDASMAVVRSLAIPPPDDGDGPTSLANLRWMQAELIVRSGAMPLDKMSRWIGFIQGCLACKGLLDVTHERDRTRPLFHEAYSRAGLIIPESISREDA